ncbi:MAG: hypothetical protein AABX54_01160 [Nanoarchaeota archaeon]
MKKWLIWVLLIIIIILVIIGWFFFYSKQSPKNVNNSEVELNKSMDLCKNSCDNLCKNIGGNYNGQVSVSSSRVDICSCNCGNLGNVNFNLTTGEKVIIGGENNVSLNEEIDKVQFEYYSCIANLDPTSCPPEAKTSGQCVDATNCYSKYWEERLKLVGTDYSKWRPSSKFIDLDMACFNKVGNAINPIPSWDFQKNESKTYFKIEERDCYKEKISSLDM